MYLISAEECESSYNELKKKCVYDKNNEIHIKLCSHFSLPATVNH